MFEILEHRAGWCSDFNNFIEKSLQNHLNSFRITFGRNNGVETDVRDLDGRIVISHDMPYTNDDKIVLFEEVLRQYKAYNTTSTLALNIKSDGLQKTVKDFLDKYSITNYFFFDGSIPDIVNYDKHNLFFCLRHSDIEEDPEIVTPRLYDSKNCTGIWIDNFSPLTHDFITSDIMIKHIKRGKFVVLVSPELHLKNLNNIDVCEKNWSFWKKEFFLLKESGIALNNNSIKICTDLPIELRRFFNEK